MSKILTLLVMSLLISPLAGCTSDDGDDTVVFPTFSAVADNDEVYNNTRMDGTPFNCCKFCREILIERERGRVDAMTKAISGGGFETSRR
jgi:hypothetical protein